MKTFLNCDLYKIIQIISLLIILSSLLTLLNKFIWEISLCAHFQFASFIKLSSLPLFNTLQFTISVTASKLWLMHTRRKGMVTSSAFVLSLLLQRSFDWCTPEGREWWRHLPLYYLCYCIEALFDAYQEEGNGHVICLCTISVTASKLWLMHTRRKGMVTSSAFVLSLLLHRSFVWCTPGGREWWRHLPLYYLCYCIESLFDARQEEGNGDVICLCTISVTASKLCLMHARRKGMVTSSAFVLSLLLHRSFVWCTPGGREWWRHLPLYYLCYCIEALFDARQEEGNGHVICLCTISVTASKLCLMHARRKGMVTSSAFVLSLLLHRSFVWCTPGGREWSRHLPLK